MYQIWSRMSLVLGPGGDSRCCSLFSCSRTSPPTVVQGVWSGAHRTGTAAALEPAKPKSERLEAPPRDWLCIWKERLSHHLGKQRCLTQQQWGCSERLPGPVPWQKMKHPTLPFTFAPVRFPASFLEGAHIRQTEKCQPSLGLLWLLCLHRDCPQPPGARTLIICRTAARTGQGGAWPDRSLDRWWQQMLLISAGTCMGT